MAPSVDVWRSATTMSGAQCVMTCGVLLMLMWSVDSWDSVMTQVMHFPWVDPGGGHWCQKLFCCESLTTQANEQIL